MSRLGVSTAPADGRIVTMSEQPPENPYQPSSGYAFPAPDHPQAAVILILGILGVSIAQVCAPIAWYLGNKAKREIESSNGTIGGLGLVNAGRICGIVGTAILALSLVIVVVAVIVIIAAASTSA